ncbi:hypothetical protein EsH8_V_000641 [Colletotrichum jinshuiense]
MRATFLYAGFYMPNISGTKPPSDAEKGAAVFISPGGMFKPTPPYNHWVFSLPASAKAIIPLYSTEDTGKCIKAAISNQDKVTGERILGATAYMIVEEIVDGFKKVFPNAGRTASYHTGAEKSFRAGLEAVGTPRYVIDETYENMVLLGGVGLYAGDSLRWTHGLVKYHLTMWEEYARESEGFASSN